MRSAIISDIEALLASEEVAYRVDEPGRAGATGPIPPDLEPRVAAAIGRDSLYHHQLDAWEAAARGEHVIVTTGTASGKTLAFNLPVLDRLARSPKSRAIYLYPTKALAQDQHRVLSGYQSPNVRPALYDGDTPSEQRRQVRRWASVLLTNPDMLHVGILPNHDRFAELLGNLTHVVIDEAHVYRGVFGSHVANVLRRLRRIAAIYGSKPQFLLASATVANPSELAAELIGAPVTVVGTDTARRSERTVVLWNPPIVDDDLGLRGSALAEAAKLQAHLVSHGLRTLVFAKSRKAAELIHRFTADRLGDGRRLSPYRAGYTAEQRREIERRLIAGDLLGVSTTNALELGIDIGLLDAVVSVGFPGTISSLRQQWGRAGRQGHGLAILVASDDALDQFFMHDPSKLLERQVEAAILHPGNTRILSGHLRAAAYEAPLDQRDEALFGSGSLDLAAADTELRSTPRGLVFGGKESPAPRTPLRSTDTDSFSVIDGSTGAILGMIERSRAYSTVHEGAVYLHLGEAYLVEHLDEVTLRAIVSPFRGDWYTQAKRDTATSVVAAHTSARRSGLELFFGDIEVNEQVVGYERRSVSSQERLDLVPLDCPPSRFVTEAVWFSPEAEQLRDFDSMPQLLSTLHAAEHALIAMLPLWAMCDRWDIGGLSTNVHADTGRPTIFIYDGHPGGIGITERGFERFEGWVEDTAAMLTGCPCATGCPSCVQSPKCGNLNDMLDKAGARALLDRMVAAS